MGICVRGYLEMWLKPLGHLDLSNFTTFDESLGWQGFQVTFQMSSQFPKKISGFQIRAPMGWGLYNDR